MSIWLKPITRKKVKGSSNSVSRHGCQTAHAVLLPDGSFQRRLRQKRRSRIFRAAGTTNSLLKSAAYLVHINSFKLARNNLLKQSEVMMQDDSGIPVKFFKAGEWKLRSFGHSGRPISIFSTPCQPELKRLFSKGEAENIDFGIGYRWQRSQSNVLIAEQR